MRRLALFALVVVFALPAAAQTPIGPTAEEPLTPKVETVIDFSQVLITAELTRPNESYIHARTKTRFRNLIELRGDFRPELARSASKLP